MASALDRDEIFAAVADSVFLGREHDSDLKSMVSRYADADALEELGALYGDNVVDMYAAERPDATPAELCGVGQTATEMFVLGFVLACHALSRRAASRGRARLTEAPFGTSAT